MLGWAVVTRGGWHVCAWLLCVCVVVYLSRWHPHGDHAGYQADVGGGGATTRSQYAQQGELQGVFGVCVQATSGPVVTSSGHAQPLHNASSPHCRPHPAAALAGLGQVFGGFLMRKAVELAWAVGYNYAQVRLVG